jgi:hypothetical protein
MCPRQRSNNSARSATVNSKAKSQSAGLPPLYASRPPSCKRAYLLNNGSSSTNGYHYWIESESKSRYDWHQSVNMSRCRAHSGTCGQILLSVRRLLSENCCLVSDLWREVGSVTCHSQFVVISILIFSSVLGDKSQSICLTGHYWAYRNSPGR